MRRENGDVEGGVRSAELSLILINKSNYAIKSSLHTTSGNNYFGMLHSVILFRRHAGEQAV